MTIRGELSQIDYPKGSTELAVGVNFNTVLVAAENIGGNDLNETVSKVLLDATNLGDKIYAATLDGSTYITDGAAVCSCFLNSDLSKKVVVLTTFANEITDETKAAIIDSLGLGGYIESASRTGNTVDFPNKKADLGVFFWIHRLNFIEPSDYPLVFVSQKSHPPKRRMGHQFNC